MNIPRIYTDPSQSEGTEQILADLDVLDGKLEAIPDTVETAEDAEIVSEYRAQFNKRIKDLEAERKEMTKPLLDLKRTLDQKFNTIKERAQRAVQLCDNMLRPYLQEQRRLREEAERAERERIAAEERARREEEEALRRAQETMDKEELREAEAKVEEARQQVDEIRRTPAKAKPGKSVTGSLGSKTGLVTVWKYRVVDISKVPEEFLVDPDDRVQKGKLNSIAKRDKGDASVPGIEFYSEDSVRSAAR